jgi:acyl-CoA thioesterase FadM
MFDMEVFISDTDAYAMVFHVNYLKFFNWARHVLFGTDPVACYACSIGIVWSILIISYRFETSCGTKGAC